MTTAGPAAAMCIVATHSAMGWPGDQACRGMPPHNDGIDMMFVDGHVKWYRKARDPVTGLLVSSERIGLWTLDPYD